MFRGLGGVCVCGGGGGGVEGGECIILKKKLKNKTDRLYHPGGS